MLNINDKVKVEGEHGGFFKVIKIEKDDFGKLVTCDNGYRIVEVYSHLIIKDGEYQ